MAWAGQVIENPVNGERVRFLQTAEETAGQSLRFESTLQPGGSVGAEHIHPRQTSRFEVRAGVVAFRVAGKDLRLREGETLTVLPGTPHRFRNDTHEEIRMAVEFRPALNTQSYFETFFALAQQGKVRGGRVRNLLQEAVLLDAYFDESYPTRPPLPVLKLIRLLAPIGRLLGYRALSQRSSMPPVTDHEEGADAELTG